MATGEEYCYHGGNKHKFEPRYDEIDIHRNIYKNDPTATPKDLRRLWVRNIYVGDICVWCGMQVKRLP